MDLMRVVAHDGTGFFRRMIKVRSSPYSSCWIFALPSLEMHSANVLSHTTVGHSATYSVKSINYSTIRVGIQFIKD